MDNFNFDGSRIGWTPIGKPASAAIADAARLDNYGVYVDKDGKHSDDDATPIDDDGTRITHDGTRIASDSTRIASDGTSVCSNETRINTLSHVNREPHATRVTRDATRDVRSHTGHLQRNCDFGR